jgi:uncharacterized membrane protein (DUF106 family)
MAEDNQGLTDDERAELEQLRAEKAERERAEKERAERAELERLRAEKAASEEARERAAKERAEDEHIAEVRERNRKLMEPDEDLHMPFAQKLVLIVLAILVFAAIIYLSGGA